MRVRRGPAIEIKTPAQLAHMREAGLVVAAALAAAAAAAVPGATTADLDAAAAAEIRAAGGAASFLGYHGFPATIAASVNDEVVHGIPGPARVLADGDVVSIDCGAIVAGWHADAALTVGVGTIPAGLDWLLTTCERALWQGLAAACPGARLTDISAAAERCVRAAGDYGIVEDYVGHGIGSHMHMDPPVPSRGRPGRGPVLTQGMALAVEPLLTLGRPGTRLLGDGWTVVTEDGSPAAHFGHTVAVTPGGPWVLTQPPAAGAAASAAQPVAVPSGGGAQDGDRPCAGRSPEPGVMEEMYGR